MANNLAVFSNAGIPAVNKDSMVAALRGMKQAVQTGVVILKMDKTGHWVFGADQIEVQDGSMWAINPLSFVHGYIAWGDGVVLAEKMCSITQPLPELDAAPAAASRGWETQIGMSMKCLNGDDVGMEVRFTATSVGGKRAVQELAASVAEQVDKDTDKVVPVVTLDSEHYQHKTWGRIYTPIFGVKKWIAMESEPAAEEPLAIESKPSKRAAAAPVEDEVEAEVVEEVAAEPAPATQRRRRATV